MKNKFVSALATLAVVAASFTPVMAEWHPSQGQTGVSVPESSTTIKVGDTDVKVTGDKAVTDGPVIYVTPESSPADPSGLTQKVYNKAMQYSGKSVDAFLTGYGVQTAVNDKLKEVAGSSAKSEDLDMLAMFDVFANDEAKALVEANGSAQITVSVPGVKASGKYIAVHFTSENSAEVLPCTWADGTVTLTMSSFSPVMILSYDEGSSTAKPSTAGKTANTSDNNNVMLYAGIMGVAIVAAGVVFFSTRKKKGQD